MEEGSTFRHGGARRKRNVVRDDGVVFESMGDASFNTYGSYGFSSNIKRAIRTGGRAGGHHWDYANDVQDGGIE